MLAGQFVDTNAPVDFGFFADGEAVRVGEDDGGVLERCLKVGLGKGIAFKDGYVGEEGEGLGGGRGGGAC